MCVGGVRPSDRLKLPCLPASLTDLERDNEAARGGSRRLRAIGVRQTGVSWCYGDEQQAGWMKQVQKMKLTRVWSSAAARR